MSSYRDDERRKYTEDVVYDVWRSGGDPDAVDYDRVDDGFDDREDPFDVARDEVSRQRRPRR